jgi:hypothetical protein
MKEKLLAQPGSPLSGGSPPSFSSSDRASLLEVLQRSRRIETRLTRFIEAEGIATGIQRPWWMDDRVMLPSPMTTIDAILKCIPENWPDMVRVVLKEDQHHAIVCHILLPSA